jgi:F0F1-type ATP synthase alpha subunit
MAFIEQFKKEIAGFTPSSAPQKPAPSLRVGDGVAEIEGLEGAVMSEMVRFDIASANA